MLEVRELRVAYGPIVAVDGLHLDVGAGQCVGLLGANGAGKTSTLRAVSGLVGHTGHVTFDGHDLTRARADAVARLGLIHVPEGRQVIPTLTVHENLQVGTVARQRRTATFGIDDVYDLFPPLARLRGRDGWTLSGGEQQMLAIGRALVAAPRLLMLDEPSLGLAPAVIDVVFGALRQVAGHTAVLLVEQNTTLALDLCAYGYVINGGQVTLEGAGDELSRRQDLLDAYLGIASVDVTVPDQSDPTQPAGR